MPFVQFSDSAQIRVIAVFSCVQDAEQYPNQATVSPTDTRYLAFRNPNLLPAQAQAALDKSDTTVLRCYSADPPVAVPAAWTTYRAALRAIANGTDTTSTSLPTIPTYPAGT